MNRRKILVVGLESGALAVLGALATSSQAQAGFDEHVGMAVSGDFNGDGDDELVVSSPWDDCGKGVIHVRGSSYFSWRRDSPGVLGVGACNQFFGSAMATADFDGDGYDDLVVSAPGASDSGGKASGTIHVFYGGSTGLTRAGDQLWHQDSAGVEGSAEQGDYFGDALAAGDFNCDGYDDVAIGVPREDVAGKLETGAVQVLYGGPGGITSVNDYWHQGRSGVDSNLEGGDHFGEALAAGNFNGDTHSGEACDDLAIGAPREGIASLRAAGRVYIMDGSPFGLSTVGDQSFHQNTRRVSGTLEPHDRFGSVLRTLNLDSDSYDDLTVFVPGDECGADAGIGRQTFHGSGSGISFVSDELTCDTFGCSSISGGEYACVYSADNVVGTPLSEQMLLSDGADVAMGGAGHDVIRARAGDDVVFGDSGHDEIIGGAGADVLIGGPGNDRFRLNRGCELGHEEIVDGGPGVDTIYSHLTERQLEALDVRIRSVEAFVLVPENTEPCGPIPFVGPGMRDTIVPLSWPAMPTPTSTSESRSGVVDLIVNNTHPGPVSVAVTLTLRVSGVTVARTLDEQNIAVNSNARIEVDLNDFVPAGLDIDRVDPELLVLPVSASLSARAVVRDSGRTIETPVAPILYGHVESDADVDGSYVVIYREEAHAQAFYGGDLNAFRESPNDGGSNPFYLGVFEGRG